MVAAITVLVLAGLVMGYQVTTEKAYDLSTYPVAAMRYVEQHDLLGSRLLTTDATAGWVILDHSPEQKVFMDDRYDMYPTSLIRDYFKLTRGSTGWDRVLARHDVETIVWPADSPLGSLLDQSADWERVFTPRRRRRVGAQRHELKVRRRFAPGRLLGSRGGGR